MRAVPVASITSRWNWPSPQDVQQHEGIEVVAVRTEEMLQRMLQDLAPCDTVAVDTETKGLVIHKGSHLKKRWVNLSRLNVFHEANDIIGIGFSGRVRRGYYIPLYLPNIQENLFDADTRILPRERVIEATTPLLTSPSKHKLIFHNAPFDFKVIKKHLDIEIPEVGGDTLILQTMINENLVNTGSVEEKTRKRKLKWLMGYYWKRCPVCGITVQLTREPEAPAPMCPNKCILPEDRSKEKRHQRRQRLIPLGSLNIGMWDNDLSSYPISEILPYAGCDPPFTLRLYYYLEGVIEQHLADNQDTGRATTNISNIKKLEYDLAPVISRIEMAGVPISGEYFENLDHALSEKKEEIKSELCRLVGSPKFKPGSADEVSDMLWRRYGLEHQLTKRQKEGLVIPVDADQLKLVRNRLPDEQRKGDPGKFITSLLDYRKYDKLHSTYVATIPLMVMADRKVHANIRALGATSGRGATSDPNLTNLPREMGDYDIRRGFVAPPGWVFVARDYKAMEFRLAAGWSQCPNMLRAIRPGEDPHRHTASVVFEIPESEVTKKQRDPSKTTNFGVIYDIGAKTLRIKFEVDNDLVVDDDQAQEFIDGFFRAYPGFKKAHAEELERIRRTLYASTAYGRIRHLKPNPSEGDIRSAFNMIIQGSGADIAKMGLINVDRSLATEFAGVAEEDKPRQVIWIHDEIITLARTEHAELVARIMQESMDTHVWGVDITTDVSYKRTLSKEEGYDRPEDVPEFSLAA